MARIFNSRGLILVLLTAVVGSGLGQLNAKPTAAATSCEVVYNIANDWGSGFIGDVTLKNTGSAVSSWTLGWSFAGNQNISNLWGGVVAQNGANVSVSNAGWNGNIGTGGTVNFGFQAGYSGANAKPTVFTLNGVTCGGTVVPTTPPTNTTVPTTPPTNTPVPSATTRPTNTTVPTTPPTSTTGPTNVPTNTPVPSATTRPTNTTVPTTPPTSTTGPTNTPAPTTVPGVHVANPFVGAQGYINSEYAARVNAEANATGGTLGSQMRQVASYPTAVWLDRIAAIAGSSESMGLRAHLDAALVQQQTSGQQVAISIVVYDLPNRDCAALASNGELKISENGLNRYKTEYIDPIAAIVGESKYASLRIVVILEPDSLSNLVTNASIPACAEAISSGAYVQGVQYAINKLNVTSNVYIYMDIAHSGWLGWDSNFTPAIQLYTQTVRGTTKGLNGIDGFISNTANYTPLNEVFLPNSGLTLGGGNPIRS
ncbi:glycoside hydrolase family 6 protein, partial [Herpetosiphon sp.]